MTASINYIYSGLRDYYCMLIEYYRKNLISFEELKREIDKWTERQNIDEKWENKEINDEERIRLIEEWQKKYDIKCDGWW